MSLVPAFWDSSALVPLCFPEAGSPIADELAQQFTPVVWWATPVEIESALARKLRTGSLSNEQSQEAAKRFEKLATRWEVIDPSDEVLSTARALLKRFDLRAADGLQLAAAIAWRGFDDERTVFITGDNRLGDAAKASGFYVKSTAK